MSDFSEFKRWVQKRYREEGEVVAGAIRGMTSAASGEGGTMEEAQEKFHSDLDEMARYEHAFEVLTEWEKSGRGQQ